MQWVLNEVWPSLIPVIIRLFYYGWAQWMTEITSLVIISESFAFLNFFGKWRSSLFKHEVEFGIESIILYNISYIRETWSMFEIHCIFPGGKRRKCKTTAKSLDLCVPRYYYRGHLRAPNRRNKVTELVFNAIWAAENRSERSGKPVLWNRIPAPASSHAHVPELMLWQKNKHSVISLCVLGGEGKKRKKEKGIWPFAIHFLHPASGQCTSK